MYIHVLHFSPEIFVVSSAIFDPTSSFFYIGIFTQMAPKVLAVLTSVDKYPTGKPTGWYLVSLCHISSQEHHGALTHSIPRFYSPSSHTHIMP